MTITGADNSIRPEDLIPLNKEFPFVEFAILLSEKGFQEGCSRFPTEEWLKDLQIVAKKHSLRLAGHICGTWTRNLSGVFEEHPEFLEIFPRIQLNGLNLTYKLLDSLKNYKNQFIFQIGNKWISTEEINLAIDSYWNEMPFDIAFLFDCSGGKGIIPEQWIRPIDSFYCGYAGGLGPISLHEQLPKILEIADDKEIWIDMETKVRSDDNLLFDLNKVRVCLEICKNSMWNSVF